jgi:glycerophosphoryl diester phosphodiesterase
VRPLLFAVLCSALFLSCNETPDVVLPNTGADQLQSATKPIKPVMRSSLEGVYRVLAGEDVFGDQVALKWSYVVSQNLLDTTFTLSVFSGKGACYFALQGGTLDSVFLFTGYWRKMVNTESGMARLVIGSSQGGRLLFQQNPVAKKDSIVLAGAFGAGQGLPDRRLVFAYDRPLYHAKRFEMLAHRGGGRTSDMLPASENSVEMILYAATIGGTGLEIDVRLTKDGVPILYHDGELNSRLTQKTGLVGSIEEYTYAQLQGMVRLIHGERIPTVQQVLEAALYRTPLRVVYLDNKNSANLELERSIQKDFIAKAAAAGRDFTVYIGIPSEDKMNEFLALPDYASAPSLCELTVDDTRKANSHVWVPRFTTGIQTTSGAQMHAEGRLVYTWTMDVPAYVQEYIASGVYDGFVTNYSPMVAFYHYTRQ